MAPGLLVAAAGVLFLIAVASDPWLWPLGLAVVVLGGNVALRGLRMEVTCGSDGVTVRGLLVTRVVPRAALQEVND